MVDVIASQLTKFLLEQVSQISETFFVSISRYLTEEQKAEMTCCPLFRTAEGRKYTFHLVTYSVHVLMDSTWNVRLTAGMLIIYRTL